MDLVSGEYYIGTADSICINHNPESTLASYGENLVWSVVFIFHIFHDFLTFKQKKSH